MAQTVIGIFQDATQAKNAIDQLKGAGIPESDVILKTNQATADSKFSGIDSSNTGVEEDSDENGITRFFKSLFGGDSEDADHYSRLTKSGSTVVSVRADSADEAERIADILDDYGAINVEENAKGQAEYSGQGFGQDRSTRLVDDTKDIVIPKIQENLEVGKRTVESGGVRVRSRIVETPVEEQVQLWQEHVNVERTPVNRPLSDTDRTDFKDQDIELIEHTEVPVVSKQARVVEEIKISKTGSATTQTIKDTVRNTEVDIDDIETKKKDL